MIRETERIENSIKTFRRMRTNFVILKKIAIGEATDSVNPKNEETIRFLVNVSKQSDEVLKIIDKKIENLEEILELEEAFRR